MDWSLQQNSREKMISWRNPALVPNTTREPLEGRVVPYNLYVSPIPITWSNIFFPWLQPLRGLPYKHSIQVFMGNNSATEFWWSVCERCSWFHLSTDRTFEFRLLRGTETENRRNYFNYYNGRQRWSLAIADNNATINNKWTRRIICWCVRCEIYSTHFDIHHSIDWASDWRLFIWICIVLFHIQIFILLVTCAGAWCHV